MSSDCNSDHQLITTYVIKQLHSGWVGHLQLPWTAACSSIYVPVATQPLNRLYTTCESSDMKVAFRLVTPVAKLLDANPSADCNFRRAQTATMVVASCAYSDSRIKTAMDVWLHMRLHTSCNSDNQPIATLIIHKLQLCWYQTRLV